MSGEQQGTFRDDLSWCYDAVQDVSRTFALTVAELDEPMADEICLGYLLCRVADTVEDASHVPPTEQHALLEQYSRVLDPADEATVDAFRSSVDEWIPAEPNDDWSVVAQISRVVGPLQALPEASQRAIRPAVRELTDGLAMFVDRYAETGGLRLQTVEELEEYCWYAAGTVGSLVTELVARDADPSVREELREHARSFALLLQLVNVAKDAAVDYREENNVYIPRELLAAEGLTVEQLASPENGDAFAPVVRQVAERAESYLDGAQAWLEAMPEVRGNTLSAWAIPFLLAVGTIRELEARPEDVVEQGDVKVSRRCVTALLGAFAGDEDPSVATLRHRMRQAPLYES